MRSLLLRKGDNGCRGGTINRRINDVINYLCNHNVDSRVILVGCQLRIYILLLRFFYKAIYDVIDFFKNREANDKN